MYPSPHSIYNQWFGAAWKVDYPEADVKGMRFLGQGPATVYQNRLAGGTLDVWNRPYNNTMVGDPDDLKPGEHFDYPVFKTGITATGAWAFIFLFLALGCTPVARLTGMRWPLELRRILGLYAFGYAFLHFAFYIVVGQKWRFDYAIDDARLIHSRLPGWASLILLLPLALTSTDGMVRRLGGKNWKRLHWLVFPAAALAIWHQAWTIWDNGTNDYHRAWYTAEAFAGLIAVRLLLWLRRLVATRASRAR